MLLFIIPYIVITILPVHLDAMEQIKIDLPLNKLNDDRTRTLTPSLILTRPLFR